MSQPGVEESVGDPSDDDEFQWPPEGWEIFLEWDDTQVVVQLGEDPMTTPVLLSDYGVDEPFENLVEVFRAGKLILGAYTSITTAGSWEGVGIDLPSDEVRIEPDDWAGSTYEEGDDDTAWSITMNGERQPIDLWAFRSTDERVPEEQRGTLLLVESYESSMSTGGIGAFVAIDEWGAGWGQVAGISNTFLGSDPIDPVDSIRDLLDRFELPPVDSISSELLAVDDFRRVVREMAEWDWFEISPDADFRCRGDKGKLAPLLEGS